MSSSESAVASGIVTAMLIRRLRRLGVLTEHDTEALFAQSLELAARGGWPGVTAAVEGIRAAVDSP